MNVYIPHLNVAPGEDPRVGAAATISSPINSVDMRDIDGMGSVEVVTRAMAREGNAHEYGIVPCLRLPFTMPTTSPLELITGAPDSPG
jgi:hypothetical protein